MNDLKEIAEEIRTQDNMATADPIFILFEQEKVPTDSDYSDEYLYCHQSEQQEYTEVGATKEEVIEFCRDNDIELPDLQHMKELPESHQDYYFNDWIEEHKEFYILYYLKKRVYKQCFFTRDSAEDYLESNKHHFEDPLIWCDSLWRNDEMQTIRNALMEGKFQLEEKILWVVYKHPKDFPDKFVARKFILDKPTSTVIVGNTLANLRNQLPSGLTCIRRFYGDDPVIVETWM